jgi:peptidylprolyl isomerase
MAPKNGDKVHVHYKGSLDDGSVFDSSEGHEPLEFVVGAGQVIPGFDGAVLGLEIGESTTVTIPAVEAYGEHHPQGVQQMPRTSFEQEPEVGWMIELSADDGRVFPATITAVDEETVTVDLNHPLAGKNLTFDIQLVEVVEG